MASERVPVCDNENIWMGLLVGIDTEPCVGGANPKSSRKPIMIKMLYGIPTD